MSEKTPELSFELLSDAMVRAKNHESVQDWPIVRQWLARNLPTQLEDGLADEENLLDTASAMLSQAQTTFIGEPAPVGIIKNAYEKAIADKPAYLKYALSSQASRLSRRHTEMSRRERLLKNMDRGIERRFARALNAKHEMETLLRDNDSDESLVDLLTELLQVRKMASFGKKSAQEAEDMIREAAEIRVSLSLKPAVEQLLAATHAKISRLLAEERKKNMPTVAVVKKRGYELRPSNGKREKRRHPNFSGSLPSADAAQPAQPQEEKMSPMDLTVAKIRAIIDADPPPPIVRFIMVEKKERQRFISLWRELFSLLGYKGQIQFLGYKELTRSNGIHIPVFVTKTMYTHMDLWDPKKYNVTVLDSSSPAIVLNHVGLHKPS